MNNRKEDMESFLHDKDCQECGSSEEFTFDGHMIDGEELLWFTCPNCGYVITEVYQDEEVKA